MATKQYLLRLEEELIQRLSDAAADFGTSSGNQVAAEVIQTYLDFWVAAKKKQQEFIEEQRAAVLGGKEGASKPAKKGTSRKK